MVRFLQVMLKRYFAYKDQDSLIIYQEFDRIFLMKAKITLP